MKMKTKKKLKNDQKKTPEQNSEKDLGKSSSHLSRRSSARLQSLNKSATPSSKKLEMVDSAYDADEESVTPNSSPDQKTPLTKDPYEMDMTDDVPVLNLKQRKKNNTKKATKQMPPKKSKKIEKSPVSNPKHMPTSTPVLHSSSSSTQSQGQNSLSATPEVTPILPYKPQDCASPANDSFATPQIHRPSRKRSLQPDSLVSLSAELSYSSHGDSGIVVSPMIKKPRTLSDTEKHAPQAELKSQKTNMIDNHMKEQKHLSRVDLNKINKKKNPISQVAVSEMHTTEQINKKNKSKSDRDSNFGFDLFESPVKSALLPVSENSPPVRTKQAKCPKKTKSTKKTKKLIVSKDSYRSARTHSSDSSLTCLTNDRIPLESSETSQEYVPRGNSASPVLFSDSFSADSESLELEVNKSSTKAYSKSFKARRTNKKTDSKMDEWASNFNMEIEDIEKFDLNIE